MSDPARDWSALLQELRDAKLAVLDDARPREIGKQHTHDKLSARERVSLLSDPHTFLESGALAAPSPATRRYTGDALVPADGVIAGTCHVHGREVSVVATDFTVLGGSIGAVGIKKIERQVSLALTSGIPLVMLLEGGGHRIQEGLDSRHFAPGVPLFRLLTKLSGWVPVVAGILGPGFAGSSNFAAMADFVVMRRGTSQMGIAGPPLVKVATGESLTAEELGGADIQADRAGIADMAVDSDAAAVDVIRNYLSYFPSSATSELPVTEFNPSTDAPLEHSLTTVVPTELRRAYDVRGVVASLADERTYLEIKPTYAANLVTALGRIAGKPVGFIANQPLHKAGALDSAACEKGAHFVSLCDAFGLPLVYLIDVPGFLVGSPAEATGLARRSGRILYELGRATVPRFSVVLRKGYGLAYVAMCGGRSFDPDLAIAWPSAEVCAMSVEGSVDIIHRKELDASADPSSRRAELIAEYRAGLGAIYGAGGYGIDDIVAPDDTRSVLIHAVTRAPARRIDLEPPRLHSISPV